MACSLPFGVGSDLRIEVDPAAILCVGGVCAAPVVGDVAAATRHAVGAPLNFPPLARAATPGDRVVIALEQGVPRGAEVAAGLVEALLEGGAAPEDLAVLAHPAEALLENTGRNAGSSWSADEFFAALPAPARDAVRLIAHDPRDARSLAYLAATRQGDPIYLNRALVDADVVLPVGCVRAADALGYLGVFGGLYPGYADLAARRRFQPRSVGEWRSRAAKLRRESDEVAWLLGAQFCVQVTPGPQDGVLAVLAGQAQSVDAAGQSLYEAAWRVSTSARADLVVAAVPGGAEQQTWENVARAVYAALRVGGESAAIAVCCDVDAPPRGLRLLDDDEEFDHASAEARDDDPRGADDESADVPDDERAVATVPCRPFDALASGEFLGTILRQARARGGLYLLSRLPEEVVEDLGITPLDDAAALGRLCKRHATCALLGHAQYVAPAEA